MEHNRTMPNDIPSSKQRTVSALRQRIFLLIIYDKNPVTSAIVKVLKSLGFSMLTELVTISSEREILAVIQGVMKQYHSLLQATSNA